MLLKIKRILYPKGLADKIDSMNKKIDDLTARIELRDVRINELEQQLPGGGLGWFGAILPQNLQSHWKNAKQTQHTCEVSQRASPRRNNPDAWKTE